MDRLKNVKGWVFDLDGTLVDSKLNFDELRSIMGMPQGHPILEYVESVARSERDHLMKVVNDYEWQGHESSTLIDGAKNLVDRIQQAGLLTAIVTRNSDRVAHASLSKFDFSGFDFVISRDHDLAPKPDPAGLLHICREWNFDPSEVVYVGDYDFDMVAAKNAGCIGLFYNPSKKEIPPETDYTFSSYNQLGEFLFSI